MLSPIHILQIGLGPIGLAITKILAKRTRAKIVGAIDIAPDKSNQDLGILANIEKLGVLVSSDITKTVKANQVDVAVLTTSSKIEVIRKQMLPLLELGIPIVTTCEELSYPWHTNPVEAKMIDDTAQKNHVAVLSTGVNPGFLMDFLPSIITGLCADVTSIQVERIQDASIRRLPFQNKIGVGMQKEQFQIQVDSGVIRHVGLKESIYLIAEKLGWILDRVEEKIEPVLTTNSEVAAGVFQIGQGFMQEKEVIRLIFKASMHEANPRDQVIIQGSPNVTMKFEHPVNGDIATAAITANAIPAILRAKPGLRTMADIEPISYWQ